MSGERWPSADNGRGGNVGRPVIPAMKLFGAWEVTQEKTPSNCIPRLCTMTINKLILVKSFTTDITSLMIAVKMQSSKRILRSCEIKLVNNNQVDSSDTNIEIDLNLQFALQYPHFLKKNGNQLQVLLQRRKRYKNRAILGYKTLAGGIINMADVLQRSHFIGKELPLKENSKDHRKSEIVATIVMSSLKSQPVDHEVNSSRNTKPLTLNESADIDSDEEVDEFSPSDGTDSEAGEENAANGSRLKWHSKRRGKKSGSLGTSSLNTPNAHQRNLKQKFIALLKKFKIPDSEASDSEEQAALENELMTSEHLGNIDDIFEFEDSDVDSPPEPDDEFSVSSTPRPGIKPFFSSKTTLVEENENVGVKRQGSNQSSDDFPHSASPKPILKPFFSSKTTLSSHHDSPDNCRVENEQQDSSGTDHTPDTSDTSLKNPFPEIEEHQKKPPNEKKGRTASGSGKDAKSGSGSKERKVKETISRLLRK